MYKRRRRDTLTGGTNDVNPQFMNLQVTQSAADTFTQVTFPVPIQRLQQSGRAQVMEVLKIFAEASSIQVASAVIVTRSISAQLTTKSFAASVNLAEPTCFWRYQKEVSNAFSTGGSLTVASEVEPYISDMTDGAGHGVLIATDNIFLGLGSTQTSISNSVTVKILYRWKDVSIQEYVGIVQSQQ